MNRLFWAMAGLLLCQGCATNPSTQAAAIKEVTARQVMNCTLISTITGKSLIGGVGATSASNALIDVKEQASGLGAWTKEACPPLESPGQKRTGATEVLRHTRAFRHIGCMRRWQVRPVHRLWNVKARNCQ